jgi:thioredoxin 1
MGMTYSSTVEYLWSLFLKHNINRHTMAATFTDSSFDTDVIKSDKLTVIDFWAEWCGPCKALGPVIEQLSTEYAGKVNVGKLDVDSNPDVSTRYGIRSIPTILFVKGGQVVDKVVGAVPKAQLQSTIEKHL